MYVSRSSAPRAVAAVAVGQEQHGRLHHRYSFKAVALSCAYQNELIFNSGVTDRNRRPSSASPRLHAASCDCRTTAGQRHQRYVVFFEITGHSEDAATEREAFSSAWMRRVFLPSCCIVAGVISPSSHDASFFLTFGPCQLGNGLFNSHTSKCTYIHLMIKKFTLNHFPTCFGHTIILVEHTLFLVKFTV